MGGHSKTELTTESWNQIRDRMSRAEIDREWSALVDDAYIRYWKDVHFDITCVKEADIRRSIEIDKIAVRMRRKIKEIA